MAQVNGIDAPFVIFGERIYSRIAARFGDGFADQREWCDLDIVGDLQMAEDARAAADAAVSPDRGTAGDPHTTRDNGMRADMHVVRNLYLVVEFHTLLDHGVVQRAAVDGGI